MIAWDHIISPDESESIVGQLAAFPEVKAYKAGRSYRGRDISVLEVTNPTTSELVSLAKLAHLASVVPGVALWSFGALMFLVAAAAASFDSHALWARVEEVR